MYQYIAMLSACISIMQCCISREAREELWIRFSAWIKELCQEEERIINREIGKVLRCIISLLEIRQHYNYPHSACFPEDSTTGAPMPTVAGDHSNDVTMPHQKDLVLVIAEPCPMHKNGYRSIFCCHLEEIVKLSVAETV